MNTARNLAEAIGWIVIVLWCAGCADLLDFRLLITLP